jgi:uncharacterized protein (TIGR00730 family)
MKTVAVYCGSREGNDPQIWESATELGEYLASKDIGIVYGGAKIGIMGLVAESAIEHNGKVIGIIPDFLKFKEVFHTGLTQLIITDNMHERKLKMNELSDGVITLPGGYGTLEEVFETITWAQLGLHQKPIGILNVNVFYDDLLKMLRKMVTAGFLKQENLNMLLIDDSVEGLVDQMLNYEPLPVPKWIQKDQV